MAYNRLPLRIYAKMIDYYSILSKAINISPDRAPSERLRTAVYRRAVKTLNGQMRLLKPSISEARIKDEMHCLLRAIERLEGEAPAPLGGFESASGEADPGRAGAIA